MKSCKHCTNLMPHVADHCPHCARPLLFPNVEQVEQPTEIAKLDQRYQRAATDLDERGCTPIAQAFEARAAATRAVMGRPIEEALRLAKADDQG